MNHSTHFRPLPARNGFDRSASYSQGCDPYDPLEGRSAGDLLPVPDETVSHPFAAACVHAGFCRDPAAFGASAFALLFG